MKKILGVIFLVAFVFILAGCRKVDSDEIKGSIFSYVNAQYEILEQFPYEDMPQRGKEERDFIKEQLGKDTIVSSVYAYNDNVLSFYCTGSGLATGSTYVGFYYSEDNTPFAMEFDGCDLTETEQGVFDWQNKDGSHRFHTERIRNHWFYYVQYYY